MVRSGEEVICGGEVLEEVICGGESGEEVIRMGEYFTHQVPSGKCYGGHGESTSAEPKVVNGYSANGDLCCDSLTLFGATPMCCLDM